MSKLFAKLLIVLALAGAGSLVAATPSAVVLPAQTVVAAETTSNNGTISTAERVETRVKESWPWFVTRASGLVAAVLLFSLVLSGIGMLTGHSFRILEPLTAWASHRAMGIALAVAVAIHIVTLLFDKFTSFSLADVLIPFSSDYRPVEVAGISIGSAWVTFGILALYALAVIIVTSLVFIDRAPHTWRLLHFLTYLVLVLVFFHALMIGTDLSSGILRIAWIAMGVVIIGAIAVRIRRARSL